MKKTAALLLLLAGCAGQPEQTKPPHVLGRVLACSLRVNGKWGMYLIYLENGEQKRIGNWENPAPAWSPDGNTLVYCDGISLRTMRADGVNDKPLSGGVAFAPEFSPDGSRIAYSTMNSVITRNLAGDDVQNWAVADVVREHPTWSPDGKRIAMTDSEGNVIISDGENEKKLAVEKARHPAWSPDGKVILLDHPDGAIRALDPETGALKPLGNARGQDPCWLRSGQGFLTAWKGPEDSFVCAYQWDAAGIVGQRLTSDDEMRDPAGNW